MKSFELELQEIYGTVFGYIGPPYPALASAKGLKDNFIDRVNPVDDIQAIIGNLKRKNPEGIEGISPMDFKDVDGELVDFSFPYEPIIKVSGANIWKRKYAQDAVGGGSNKTFWNEDDWNITLKGIFVNQEEDLKPVEDMKALVAYKKKGLVKIQSYITDIYKIQYMAIKNIDFLDVASERLQPFVITGWSDFDDYTLFE